MTDAGQVLGCYSGDPENKDEVNDTVDLRVGTFIGTDPDTGNAKEYVYIDPVVALVNFDANKTVWPQGQLQLDKKGRKRVGGKYISQV